MAGRRRQHRRQRLADRGGGGRAQQSDYPIDCRFNKDTIAERILNVHRLAKAGFRAELCERSFALVLDRGGMRRAWLRGGENLRKRYLVHVAGYNLGLVMRLLVGAGTPREFLARASAHLLVLASADGAALVILVVTTGTEVAMLVVSFEPEPPG